MAEGDRPKLEPGPIKFDGLKPRKIKRETDEQHRLRTLRWEAYRAEMMEHKPALSLPRFDKRPKRKPAPVDPRQLGLFGE